MSVQLHPHNQGNNTEDFTLSKAISMFLDIEFAVSSTQTTIWYRTRLSLFKKKISVNRVSQIKEHHLWYWYKNLQSRVVKDASDIEKISVHTQHGYIRAVRRFLKWSFRRGLIESDLTHDLKLPKLPKGGKKGISDYDVNTLLEATMPNTRDYAILRFIESTGCRRGGIANLRLSDLNLEEPGVLSRRATVLEKGSKERIVFLSNEAISALRSWLKERESNSNFVFISFNNRNSGLTPSGVSQILQRYKGKCGLEGKVSPHQWRHRHGRKLTEAGMPLGLVSQVLGHTNVAVTNDYYGMFAVGELQRALENYYIPPKNSRD